jgi:glutathione S-transferase
MKLYGCPNSRSLRAAWALEEAAAEYEYVLVDLFKGASRTPEFLALNPAGKLPVLVEGELTLTESGAIINYVSDKFPASDLVPRDAAARANCLRWMFFANTELEQPLWTIAKHRFALPKAKRIAGVEDTARWKFASAAKLHPARPHAGLGALGENPARIGAPHCVYGAIVDASRA